jgi:hypothetical protein
MLDVSPAEAPAPVRPERTIREYRTGARAGIALRLVLLLTATTLVVGFVAASAFAGLLYQLSSVLR